MMGDRKNRTIRSRVRDFAITSVLPLAIEAIYWTQHPIQGRLRKSTMIRRYAKGNGLEVGAGVNPAMVPLGTTVQYADRFTPEEQLGDAELNGWQPVDVTYVTPAETLATVPSQNFDFCIAFHLLEHTQDPIRTLQNFHRILRPRGVLLIAVPDRDRNELDSARPLTTFAHVLQDYEQGPAASREGHFSEAGELGFRLSGSELASYVSNGMSSEKVHTHFHVWSAKSFIEFIQDAHRYLGIPVSLNEMFTQEHEIVVALSQV